VDTYSLYSGYVCGYGYPWISIDIHRKSVDMDMDMDVKFHIHGNPANASFVPYYCILVRRAWAVRLGSLENAYSRPLLF